MAVVILLPFELLTGRISWLATRTADLLTGSGGSEWKSPIKEWVKYPVNWLKDGLKQFSLDGTPLGIAMVTIGIGVVVVSLIAITKNMKALIAERLEASMNRECEQKIHEYMRSEEPGHWAVPRAVLHRYWKRIVANLAGIVSSAIEPIQTLDYADGGSTDIVDD
ncbi:MAG: hypothetical protein ISP35_04365 [Ilumatobacteraceae bacterium]|nr:hypothetical protein [Ilumatobacteraceae bacterium]